MDLVAILLPCLLPIGLVMFTISLWKFYVNNTRDHSCNLPLPPGSVGLPFVGETPELAVKGFEFYRQRALKHGHVYKTHILGRPTIRVWGEENIHKILKNEESLVTLTWPRSVSELIGPGCLISSTRRLHNMRRAAIMKAFTVDAINGYAPVMEAIIEKRINSWCCRGEVSAKEECRLLAFEVTIRLLLGCQCTDEQIQILNQETTVIIENFFTLPVNVPGLGFHKGMKARARVLAILDNILARETLEVVNDSAFSILKQQVKNGVLTLDELKDAIIEMLVSAINGGSSLCCSALIELARHNNAITHLLKQLSEFELLSRGSLKADVLGRMPYLQKLWKELLRFAPPFGGGFRYVLKTFELEGYQIPEGWTVIYSIRENHQAEENFSKPESFDPERWSSDSSCDAFIPFGGNGIRSCVAQRFNILFIQQFICQIVRLCEWELLDKNTSYTHYPVQQPNNQLPITVKNRKLPTKG